MNNNQVDKIYPKWKSLQSQYQKLFLLKTNLKKKKTTKQKNNLIKQYYKQLKEYIKDLEEYHILQIIQITLHKQKLKEYNKQLTQELNRTEKYTKDLIKFRKKLDNYKKQIILHNQQYKKKTNQKTTKSYDIKHVKKQSS